MTFFFNQTWIKEGFPLYILVYLYTQKRKSFLIRTSGFPSIIDVSLYVQAHMIKHQKNAHCERWNCEHLLSINNPIHFTVRKKKTQILCEKKITLILKKKCAIVQFQGGKWDAYGLFWNIFQCLQFKTYTNIKLKRLQYWLSQTFQLKTVIGLTLSRNKKPFMWNKGNFLDIKACSKVTYLIKNAVLD